MSSCTIPLDEEDEETCTDLSTGQPTPSSHQGTILSRKMNKLPEETQCELLAQQLLDMMQPACTNNGGTGGTTSSTDNTTVDEAAYKKLVSLIGKKFF